MRMVEPTANSDAMLSAEEAGLRYVSDETPGITRRRAGTGFCYYDPHGSRVTSERTLKRIRSLVIPPAWTDVWICPSPTGHIQAIGRDAKGRKQYKYHPDWQAARDQEKFTRILAFARTLPKIRAAVAADLKGRKLDRRTVLATVVRLLETTLIRVGNREYAEQNKSYGLTTLRNRHVEIHGSTLEFDFLGKSGKQHVVRLSDRRVARILKQLQDLPGQELFKYLDANGVPHSVDSADVNAYLREISGDDFTAKHFRTWAGTVLAAWALSEFERIDSKAAVRRNITAAVKKVAGQLGNTPAVCRSSYIHPEILDAYMDGSLIDHLKREIKATLREELDGLSSEETAVFVLLLTRLEQAA
jgi:DNA topoisomerase-1